MRIITCINCGEKLEIDGELKIAQLIDCQHCHKTMEVVWLFPLDLMPYDRAEELLTSSPAQD